MSSPNCAANPDISGIGVRTAIYSQAVLTLVQPILASLDGNISKSELTSLHQLYLGILLPGCALIFSAIIHARTHGLSVYHAIIVLNLSWINNTSALIFFQFALIAQIRFENDRESRNKVLMMLKLFYEWLGSDLVEEKLKNNESQKQIIKVAATQAVEMGDVLQCRLDNGVFGGSKEMIEEVIGTLAELQSLAAHNNHSKLITFVRMERGRLPKDLPKDPALRTVEKAPTGIRNLLASQAVVLLQRDWIMTTLASAHLIIFASFGLWLWSTIDHFGDCHPPSISVSIFFPVFITSRPLHYSSIVLYIISVLPFINIVFLCSLEFAAIYSCQRLLALLRAHRQCPTPSSFLKTPGRAELYQFVALTFLVQTFLITTTELTIHNNRHVLEDYDQENDWTFGQTLAIALITLPLFQVWNEVWRKENVDVFKKWFNLT